MSIVLGEDAEPSAGQSPPECQRRRPRVLLMAYTCSPYRGSEPGIGWNHAVATARNFDTWVLTCQQAYGDDIRRYLQEHGKIDGLEFVFVEKARWEMQVQRVPGMYWPMNKCWNRRAYHVARKLHAELRFDIVHQLTLCGYREPGFAWKLDAPFVWGPVGGTQNFPWRFFSEASLTGGLQEVTRNVLNHVQLRCSPRVRHASCRAVRLLAANSTNERDLQRVLGVRPTRLLETGVPRILGEPRRAAANVGPLRILWSGNLEPWKGLPLLLRAVADLPPDTPWSMKILGSGRLEPWLRRLAKRLGVHDRIEWLGWLPHAAALGEYQWADIFAFTSLRDTSGNVVLEALAAGVPVICLDHQGARDMITAECGVKIPVTSPEDVRRRLTAELRRLGADPELRSRLSVGAVARAGEYLWSRRSETFATLYREVLHEQSQRGPAERRRV